MYIRLFLILIILFTTTLSQAQKAANPRIYYHSEKLLGKPIETKVINLKVFDSIIRDALKETYKIGEKSRLILKDGEFDSVYVDMFKYCTVRKDGITYDADEGSFYLPEAIILFDVSDYTPFPSDFYFIAKINDQLELCRGSGGKDVQWYQLPDSYTVVDDPVIIEKVEETIDYFEGFVAYELERQKEEANEEVQ